MATVKVEHNKMSSHDEIQRILDQNALLIKSIIVFQNEGRVLDAMIYKAKLQKNLEFLTGASESGIRQGALSDDSRSSSDNNANTQIILSKFVHTVKENGLKNPGLVSEITGIPLEKIVPLAQSYIGFLKRHNQFTEAKQLENELSLNGV